MKRFVSLLLLCTAFLLSGQERPWPGDTIYLESTFTGGMNHSGGENSRGPWINLDLSAGSLWRDGGVALQAGLAGATLTSGESAALPMGAIQCFYDWIFLNSLQVQPRLGGGLFLAVPSEEGNIHGVLQSGVNLAVHLHNRHYLKLTGNWNLPLYSGLSPFFTFGLGYGRRETIRIPVQETGLTVRPDNSRFSPDGDGENDFYTMAIHLDHPRSAEGWEINIYDPEEQLFYASSGTGVPPEKFIWNGRSSDGEWVNSAVDYRLELQVTDKAKNRERVSCGLRTDILVLREGDKLKIRIPSIMFSPDSSSLILPGEPEITGNNREILSRLYTIFLKFPEYRIQIEGHANNLISGSDEQRRREEENVLIPLSLNRAESVKEGLVELGIEEERITCLGMGGSVPLFPIEDQQNLWKNRRVEFILLKREP